VSWTVAGVELVTALDVRERWGDVRADRLRDWVRTGRLRLVTRGQLAALAGRPVPDLPDEPARVDGPGKPANLYRWADVVACEADIHATRPGRRHAA